MELKKISSQGLLRNDDFAQVINEDKYEDKDIDYKDYMISKFNSIFLAFKESFETEKRRSIVLRTPDFVFFKRYCSIEYIKHLDSLYKKGMLQNDCITKSSIANQVTDFLCAIIDNNKLNPSHDSINRSLKYLHKSGYISCEEREYITSNRITTMRQSYTCNPSKENILKYMIKSYTEEVFLSKEFCILLNTTESDDSKKIREAIINTYTSDILSIEYHEPESRKNAYNDSKSYLRIIAKEQSTIFDDLALRKETNIKKGNGKQKKKVK